MKKLQKVLAEKYAEICADEGAAFSAAFTPTDSPQRRLLKLQETRQNLAERLHAHVFEPVQNWELPGKFRKAERTQRAPCLCVPPVSALVFHPSDQPNGLSPDAAGAPAPLVTEAKRPSYGPVSTLHRKIFA